MLNEGVDNCLESFPVKKKITKRALVILVIRVYSEEIKRLIGKLIIETIIHFYPERLERIINQVVNSMQTCRVSNLMRYQLFYKGIKIFEMYLQ